MGLEHPGRKVAGDRRHVRRLKRTCSNDDLVSGDRLTVDLEQVLAVLGRELSYDAVQLDREVEGLRVELQVRDCLVARWVAVGISRKREPGKAVVAAGSEQAK